MHKFWHIKVWHVFTFNHNYQFLDSNHFLFVYIVYPGTRIFIYLKYFIIRSGSFSTTSPSSEQSSTWSPCYHVSVVQSVQSTDRFIWTRKSVVCIPSSSPSSANKLTYTNTHTPTLQHKHRTHELSAYIRNNQESKQNLPKIRWEKDGCCTMLAEQCQSTIACAWIRSKPILPFIVEMGQLPVPATLVRHVHRHMPIASCDSIFFLSSFYLFLYNFFLGGPFSRDRHILVYWNKWLIYRLERTIRTERTNERTMTFNAMTEWLCILSNGCQWWHPIGHESYDRSYT